MAGRLLLFDLHDLATTVVATVGAYVVRQMLVAAVRAIDQVPRPQRMVGSAPVAPPFGGPPFGERWHFVSLSLTELRLPNGQAGEL